jgi:hypothetical protein
MTSCGVKEAGLPLLIEFLIISDSQSGLAFLRALAEGYLCSISRKE